MNKVNIDEEVLNSFREEKEIIGEGGLTSEDIMLLSIADKVHKEVELALEKPGLAESDPELYARLLRISKLFIKL